MDKFGYPLEVRVGAPEYLDGIKSPIVVVDANENVVCYAFDPDAIKDLVRRVDRLERIQQAWDAWNAGDHTVEATVAKFEALRNAIEGEK